MQMYYRKSNFILLTVKCSFFSLQLSSSQQFKKEVGLIAYSKGPCTPQYKHCANCSRMSGMMSNAIGGPAAGVGGLSDLSSLIHA